jgi:iron complex outermembrane receptor protein
MSKSILFISVLTIIVQQTLFAQSLTGAVYRADAASQTIPYAKIAIPSLDTIIVCNVNGSFTLPKVSEGDITIILSASGFETKQFKINSSKNGAIRLELRTLHRELDKIIVSNNGVLQRESITNVSSNSLADLKGVDLINLGEALAQIPGVAHSSVGSGIQKPVIRGLSGSRVVTYVNGLRIQNQQWGNDHGLPITSLGIGQVEVIKGPSSLLYGADALGGVVYFIDEPYAPSNTTSGYIKTNFNSNTMGTVNEAGIKWSRKKLKLAAYGGIDNHADYRLANGDFLGNSRFKQNAAKVSIGYTNKNWTSNLRYNFYGGRLGLPGHTHDSLYTPESFQTKVQNRSINSPAQEVRNHFTSFENKFYLGKNVISVTLGNTFNHIEEFEEKLLTPDIVMSLNNTLYNVKWKTTLDSNLTLVTGSQGMYQLSTNGNEAIEFLIPDANTTDLGLYTLLLYKKNLWNFQAGARIDNRRINTTSNIGDFAAFNANYLGYNFSAGAARIAENFHYRLNISSGFRAPTTAELLSDGVHHGAFRYEIGNSNLSIEQAVQIDASVGIHFHDFELLVNPFFNFINNYIYLQNTNTTQDGYNVYEYTQADFAQLYGTDISVHYHPHQAHWIHLESSFSTVIAEDNLKNALPLIPQTRILSQIRLETGMKGNLTVESLLIQHQFFFQQNRVANYEEPTAHYHLLNASLLFHYKQAFTFSVGARNILNSNYFDHLSAIKYLGIPNPGIAVFCSFKYAFNKKI